jgi:tetratricopeptide (TPR) repeat protein
MLACVVIIPAGADNIDAINYYNKAVELAYQGDYGQAMTEIDRALQENENFTLAWVTKAGILNSMELFDEGLAASDRALALDPDNVYAWINRATSLNGLGRYEESLAASDKALSLNPDSEEAEQNRQIALDMLAKPVQTTKAGLSPVTVLLACAGVLGLILLRKRD